jgi:hypothetical protein
MCQETSRIDSISPPVYTLKRMILGLVPKPEVFEQFYYFYTDTAL